MSAFLKFVRHIDGVVGVLVFLLAAVTFVAGYGAPWAWQLELLTHMRLLQILLFVIALMLLLIARYRKWAIVVAVFLVFSCIDVVKYSIPNSTSSWAKANAPVDLTIVQMNLYGAKNREFEKTIQVARACNPDVIALSEVTQLWWDRFVEEFPEYKYQVVEPHSGGMGLMSRLPLAHPEVLHFGSIKRPRIVAEVTARNGEAVHLDFIHPGTPGDQQPLRDKEFDLVASEVNNFKGPTVLFGDFNCSPWSPVFAQLLEKTGLTDTEMGIGIQPSWGLDVCPMPLLPIDHVLISKDLVTINRKVIGTFYGSDHRALVVELGLKKVDN